MLKIQLCITGILHFNYILNLFKYKAVILNCNNQFQKTDPYDWFCGPGSHIIQHKTNL